MSVEDDLRRQGWPEDLIERATVNGKPLMAVFSETKKLGASTSGMNKTEALYAAELDWLKSTGEVAEWHFESFKIRIAKRTWYMPDFFVVFADGRKMFVEIKGFLRDDAAVKFKAAREKVTWAEWLMLRRTKGEWVRVNI
jgi:hypothetical protein